MRITLVLVTVITLMMSCDPSRVYEVNHDFEERYWLATEEPEFGFTITDINAKYNLYLNVRNEVAYPYANVYITYNLADSLNNELDEKLVNQFLFDKKTGKPFGSSVLGDIYDHQLPLLQEYTFGRPGKYIVRYKQFMRRDTLEGILSVGLRVERSLSD